MTNINDIQTDLAHTVSLQQLFLHIAKALPMSGVWASAIDTLAPDDSTFWTGNKNPFHQQLLARSSTFLPVEFWQAMKEKYGSNIFTQQDNFQIDMARMFFFGTKGTKAEHGPIQHPGVMGRTDGAQGQKEAHVIANFLVQTLPKRRVLEILEERYQYLKTINVKEIYGIPTDDLEEHPIKPLAILMHDDFIETAGALIERFPDLHHARLGRYNAASMMIGTNRGWKTYLTNGGSLAAPVWRGERMDEETPTPISVGEWLFLRNALPPQAQVDIARAVLRMATKEAPKDGDRNFDDASFEVIHKKNQDFSKQIRSMAFEKDLIINWREALRGHSTWRAWRSAEGATVMHSLAVHNPHAFFQIASTRSNSKLTHLIDNNGDSIIPYVLIGAATGSKFGDDGKKKVNNRRLTAYEKINSDFDDILSQDPKRGVMVSFIEGHPMAFCGGMDQARRAKTAETPGVQQIIMNHPQWIWAGWTEETTRTLFSSPDRHKQIEWLVTSLIDPVFNGTNVWGATSDQDDGLGSTIRHQLKQQPFHIRFSFAILSVHQLAASRTYSYKQPHQEKSGKERLAEFITEVAQDALEECPNDLARGAMSVIDLYRSSQGNGYQADKFPQLEAALDRVILANGYSSKEEQLLTKESEPIIKRPRRL